MFQTLSKLLLVEKNPAPLRMPQMLALNTSINTFLGQPKCCKIFLSPYQPYVGLFVSFTKNPHAANLGLRDLGGSGEVSRTLALSTLQSQADSLDTLEAVDGLVATAWDG